MTRNDMETDVISNCSLSHDCFFFCGEVGTVMAQNATGNLTGGNMTSVGNTTNITVGGSGNMTTAPPGGGD